jgi:hypothetical protein
VGDVASFFTFAIKDSMETWDPTPLPNSAINGLTRVIGNDLGSRLAKVVRTDAGSLSIAAQS